jgi:branched-chain amino acid transport system substrate-binding protein
MKKIFLAFSLIFSIFFTSCVQKGGDTNNGATGDTIKVGMYVDLSGATSSFGQSTKKGIELAVEEINAAGGVNGKKIQLLTEDDQGRPEQAKTVVQKLISQDKVQAVLGEVASTNSLAAAPVAQEAKIPMITPSSTNPKVTEVGDYIFRVCFLDDFQGSSIARFAYNNLNAKTAAIFGDVNSDYSKGLTEFFEKEFTSLGGKVIDKQAYTQNDTDFKGQLTNIRQKNPDVIYIPGYYGEVGIIAKQARELGMNMPLLGGDGWDSPKLWELGGDALKNSYITNHYSIDDPSPKVQNFVKAFKAKYNGETPDSLAALAYDSAYILADALKRAGSSDPKQLRDAIAATKGYDAVTGTISINDKRNADKSAVVLEVKPDTKQLLPKAKMQPDGTAAATDAAGNTNANAATANSSNMTNTGNTNTSATTNSNSTNTNAANGTN